MGKILQILVLVQIKPWVSVIINENQELKNEKINIGSKEIWKIEL